MTRCGTPRRPCHGERVSNNVVATTPRSRRGSKDKRVGFSQPRPRSTNRHSVQSSTRSCRASPPRRVPMLRVPSPPSRRLAPSPLPSSFKHCSQSRRSSPRRRTSSVPSSAASRAQCRTSRHRQSLRLRLRARRTVRSACSLDCELSEFSAERLPRIGGLTEWRRSIGDSSTHIPVA